MAVRRRKKASQQQGRSMPCRVTDPDDTGTPTSTTSQRARFSYYYCGGILGALVVVLMIVVLVGMNLLEVGGPTEQEAAAAASVTPPPAASAAASSSRPPTFTPGSVAHRGSFRVLAQYPHDAAAFTQGLEVANATHAYESTGLYGESTVRLVEVSTGRVGLETAMEDAYFGEGLTLVGSSGDDETQSPYLLQLTWRKGVAFCYDPETLAETCRFDYATTNGEGWGIAYDTTANNNTSDNVVYVTDGTDYLHTWRLGTKDGSRTYAQTDRVPVQVMLPERDSAQRIPRLNELEYDATTRTLLANVWFENVLLRIDPQTGWVTTVYDLSSLYTDRAPGADVLNGIAVLPGTKGRELWVTGKLWPVLYHIELTD